MVQFTTRASFGEYGFETPLIWHAYNYIIIYPPSGTHCELHGAIDSLQNVAYKHTKRSDGKFWIEILLDGALKCQYENTTPRCMENMKFYASNPWNEYHPSPATINKFKIITGKLVFIPLECLNFY